MYDVAVIGGGPAGLSAAIQVRARGKSVLVVSGDDRDNPLYKTERIDNYLGFYDITGAAMMEQFRAHALRMGVERKEGRVLNIMPMNDTFYLSIGSDMEQAQAVVLATGVVRSAKYPGEGEHLGAGVSYCATCDGMLYRGKAVAVLGYTDTARKEADFLRGLGCSVTYFNNPRTCEIRGDGQVSSVTCDGETAQVEGVFILRPTAAPGDLFPGLTLENGYVAVDRKMATNLPGLFAAGDCTGGPLQVSKAAGEGLIAGQSAAAYVADLLRAEKKQG